MIMKASLKVGYPEEIYPWRDCLGGGSQPNTLRPPKA